MTAGSLQAFKDLVRQRCGLMLDGIGEETLRTALVERMEVSGQPTARAYLTLLKHHEGEFQELVSLLTINETYFFREAEQLTLLTERLMPRLLQKRSGDQPIRILSAGCSSGEEPYSIAMALLEKYGDSAARMVSIVGGDIDQRALSKARLGSYGAFSFRGVSEDLKQRYFTQQGNTALVADKVRAMVTFQQLNLLSATQPDGLATPDIILFRNVSIYFDTPTRKAILQNLNSMMGETGILLVGTAETLANDLAVFRLIEEDGLFYFVKGQAGPVRAAMPAKAPLPATAPQLTVVTTAKPRPRMPMPPRQAPVAPPVAPPVAVDLEAICTLLRDKRYEPALAALGAILADSPDNTKALVLDAYAKVQTRDFASAEVQAKRALEQDSWSIEAFVLLGFTAKWSNDIPGAISWFKQAVYARHDCWVAQFYLAEAYRAANHADLARRAYRVALQHLGGQPHPDGGLFLPLGLPVSEVRFLCERHAGSASVATSGRG